MYYWLMSSVNFEIEAFTSILWLISFMAENHDHWITLSSLVCYDYYISILIPLLVKLACP